VHLWAVVAVLASAACQGAIGGPTFMPGDGTERPGVFTVDTPVPSTRTARLSHVQWENTVVDLLHLDGPTGLSASFRADPAQAGFLFGNNAETLEVDQALWGTYQRAAAELAERVTSDPASLARLAPAAGATDEERARALVTELGGRAHRRPLGEDDVDDYMDVWTAGSTAFDGVPPFEAGVRLVIEAMLQSPYFLYRIEASTTADERGGVIPLDGYEIAARLSYLLWNSMPDEVLFAAAEDGSLRGEDEAAAQVERMLADARAVDIVARFHEIVFEADSFGGIAPAPAFFPDVSPRLGAFAAQEQDLFVRDLYTRGAGLRELLTSTETFVNADLARVYGLPGDHDDTFVPATLDPTQRSGILTHVGFLAKNATSVNPDPIHRGVFVAKRMACIQIAAPPADVPPLPALDGTMTTRQAVEAHTETEGSICATCHETTINRFGFTFEHYDAIGAFRTEDVGQLVDSSAEPPLDGVNVPVADAVELSARLAASRAVHDCYVQHWVEYAYGRPRADEDEPLITRLGEQSLDEGLSLRDLVVALATSRAFLNRSTEELP
jgi:hypothetical protein